MAYRHQYWDTSGQATNWAGGHITPSTSREAALRLSEPTATRAQQKGPGLALYTTVQTLDLGPTGTCWQRPQNPPTHTSGQALAPEFLALPTSMPSLASEAASPISKSTPATGQLQPQNLRTQLTNHQANTRFRNPGPHSQLCQEPVPPTSSLTPALEPRGPAARPQYPTLPASGPALAPVPGFTHQWAGTSPGISWTPTPPTSKPALALGCSRIPQPAVVWPSPANELPAASAQGRAWQPIRPGANQAHQTTHSSQSHKTEGPTQPTWGHP